LGGGGFLQEEKSKTKSDFQGVVNIFCENNLKVSSVISTELYGLKFQISFLP